MILYVLKSGFCLAILLAVYHLFLEKEKMHRFNRWYLLGSILFSFLVPLIRFKVAANTNPVLQNNYFELIDNSIAATLQPTDTAATINAIPDEHPVPYAWIIYVLITILLLIRFIKNLYQLISAVSENEIVKHGIANLVLVKDKIASYSFLNYIFISEADYTDHNIEQEIITHELTHVKEKHSLDVLFIELLQTLFWFNPLLVLYKKAIQLNHEFLADDAVIKTYENIPAYQCLLLEKVSFNSNAYLTSNLNYSVTKKRFIMMTRHYDKQRILLKKVCMLPVLAAGIFLFSSKNMIAQEKKNDPPEVVRQKESKALPIRRMVFAGDFPANEEGVSAEQVNEFNTLAAQHVSRSDSKKYVFNGSAEDEARMLAIFKQMNRQQRQEAKVGFSKRSTPFKKAVPTDALMEKWKNPSDYGVWIDGKKVDNSALNKYRASDFSHYYASNLNYTEKMKQDIMRSFQLKTMYKVQLDMMTNAEYERYYNATMASPEYSMYYHVTYDEKNKRPVEWRTMIHKS